MIGDTIAAISSPLGEGGIGIVRMSGPQARAILGRLFVGHVAQLAPYRLHHGHVVDSSTGEPVDEVLACFMPAPRTYTRQDVAEINCHGGIAPLRRVLELCMKEGARLAHPGEFTLRAFLNGRIDLAQAEAVLDVVRARTEASLRVAVDQLGGHLSARIREVRAELVDVLAHLEAAIDFAEDEIPEREIAPDLERAAQALDGLLAQADAGLIYRQGIRTAIVGRPNVGKSSLLNALLRTSRAIVTPIPGTTRDTLEETVNIQGIPLVLVDTAGIATDSQDVIERLGIKRSRAALERADLALLVIDGSEPLQEADLQIAGLVANKTTIVVVNKSDLPQMVELSSLLPQALRVATSALTGDGLGQLEEVIAETIFAGKVLAADEPAVSNPRHKAALQRAVGHVQAAMRSHQADLPADFVSIDLTAAISALGEITGQTVTEDLLESIFSQFCVGK